MKGFINYRLIEINENNYTRNYPLKLVEKRNLLLKKYLLLKKEFDIAKKNFIKIENELLYYNKIGIEKWAKTQ